MKPTKKVTPLLALLAGSLLSAQGNTAIASGSIGKCAVWDYPYTLYNNSGASQTVNNGITVTVDQNRNIGSVNFSGNGAMDMSGSNGITLSGSGGDLNCRWDLPGYGNHVITNNNGNFSINSLGQSAISYDSGAIFAAPYAGNYRWQLGSGWSASMSGSYLNGSLGVRRETKDYYGTVFSQNEAGSCGLSNPSSTTQAATWFPNTYGGGPLVLTAGQNIYYSAATTYRSSGGCTSTQLNFTIGTATLYFEN